MKKLTIAALLAAQMITAAQPAFAADFATTQDQQAGVFAGLRLRVPLDGAPRERQIRAGLALAPTLHSRSQNGAVRLRIGEGMEFGYRSNRPLSFSLAGQDLGGFRLGAAEEGRRRGLSTGKILLIVGGVVIVSLAVATLVFVDALNDASD